MPSRWMQPKLLKMRKRKNQHNRWSTSRLVPRDAVQAIHKDSRQYGSTDILREAMNSPAYLMQTDRLQMPQEWLRVILPEDSGPYLKLYLLSCSDRFMFEELNLCSMKCRRSIVYRGRQRAVRVYEDKRITWSEEVAIIP